MPYHFGDHAAIARCDSSCRVFAVSRSAVHSHSIVQHVQYCTANGECLQVCARVCGAYCCVLGLLTLAVAVMLQAKIR
jgi:hypothetical protein